MAENPSLEEIERWQAIYEWFVVRNGWKDESDRVRGFLTHMIASTNISAPPSNPPDQTKGLNS